MTTHAFQTEVQQLLHLMIHSLYTEREVFLRELISNASDACDKLRFTSLTQPALLPSGETLRIDVRGDGDRLIIRDNGIGLTEAQAVEHLGTIAKSGTKAFLQALQQGKAEGDAAKNVSLIGQFGVGFYSAFMVADEVVVESRAAGVPAEQGVRWSSKGDGNFSTEAITLARRGTTITLHLKEDAKEFAQTWRQRALIKKYSDYLPYPVFVPKNEDEAKKGEPGETEQANTGQALWTRPKDQITDEQYGQFYKSVAHAWDEPATRLHLTVEGTLSFTALLFVPTQRPMGLFDRDKHGLNLYVRRVFVMDDCKDLLPEWLRFIRGVVDSDDLPLNVSREILQQQDTVHKLRKQLVKKLTDHLLKLAQSTDEAERATWTTIDETFGTVIREGIVTDHENKDRVARLARYASTWTTATPAEGETRPAKTGLEDYVRRMGAEQKAIYVVTAPDLAGAKASPHVEGAVKRRFEVLFLADPVDEWVVNHLDKFDGKDVVNLSKGDHDLSTLDSAKQLAEQAKTYEGFLGFCKESLGGNISEVKLTDRLASSPCRLVAGAGAVPPGMEEMMRRMGQTVPERTFTLELNGEHPLVQRLQSLHAADAAKPQLKDWVGILRDQALLAEGQKPADPAAFAKRVQDLLLAAAGPTPAKAAQAG
jgi:molecular chaperone HtpG